MKYRIIQNVDGVFVKTEPLDIIAWADVAGVAINGYHRNLHQRAELQGHPKLVGFCGPMWDGDAIRYEDQRSNDILSV